MLDMMGNRWRLVGGATARGVAADVAAKTEAAVQPPKKTQCLAGGGINVLPAGCAEEVQVAPPSGCASMHSVQPDFAGFVWLLADMDDGRQGQLFVLDPRGPGYTDDGLAMRSDPLDHPVKCTGVWHGDHARHQRWVHADLADEVMKLDTPPGTSDHVSIALRDGTQRNIAYSYMCEADGAVELLEPAEVSGWSRLGGLMPCGNHDIQACMLGHTVYVAGGALWWRGYPAETHMFDELWALDLDALGPADCAWRAVCKLPGMIAFSGLASLGTSLFVVGGCTNLDGIPNKRTGQNQVWIYDTDAATWSHGPPMHAARQECACASLANRIYAFGWGNSVESYGAGEASWRDEPTCPVALGGEFAGGQFAVTSLGDTAYVAGAFGLLSFHPTGDGSGNWTKLPAPPTSGAAPLVCAHNNRIVVLGGFFYDPAPGLMCSLERIVYAYDPVTQQWEELPPLPTVQSWGGSVSTGKEVLAIGGAHWSPRAKTFVFENRTFTLNV